MKGVLLTLSLIFSSLTFAQDRGATQDRMLQKAQQLKRVLQRNSDLMSAREMLRTIGLMDKAIEVARGQVGPGPGPGGGGGGGHAPRHGAMITVELEDTSFLIQVVDVQDLVSQCEAKARTLSRSSIDDISVSINGGPTARKHTSGWWSTTAQKCAAVSALALEQAFKQGINLSRFQFVVSGDADGIGILAEGNSVSQLEDSCIRNIASMTSVDDVSVSLNGGPKRTQHTSGWWTTKAQVCSVAIATAFN